MRQRELQREISRLIWVDDLMEIFAVTRTTITDWRERQGLDKCEIIVPGQRQDSVRFRLDEVLEWASKQQKPTPGLKLWKRRNRERL